MGSLYKKTQDLSGVSKKRKEEIEKLTQKQKFENKWYVWAKKSSSHV